MTDHIYKLVNVVSSPILHSVFGTTTPHDPTTSLLIGPRSPKGEVSDIPQPLGKKKVEVKEEKLFQLKLHLKSKQSTAFDKTWN